MTELDRADPELLELARGGVRARTASPAAALAVVSGAFDGLERVLQAHLRPGDRVIIEDPAYTSIRDLLLALGLIAVPVPVDEFGLLPEALAAALAEGAEAMVIVPRAQNPFGAAMDAERAAALRRELEPYPDLLRGRGRPYRRHLRSPVHHPDLAGAPPLGGDPVGVEGPASRPAAGADGRATS